MHNFFRVPGIIKNSGHSEEEDENKNENKNENENDIENENDLNLTLSLGFGSPKRARQSSPSPPPTSSQTNTISLIEISMPMPYTNSLLLPSTDQNTSPLLVSSLDHNTNPGDDNDAANVDANVPTPALTRRPRRVSYKHPTKKRKNDTVPAPFRWATNRRATVHSHKYLLENNILTITGEVQCKRCEHKFEVRLDLEEKVAELRKFIQKERDTMHDRAPAAWANPVLPKCLQCGRENSTKPISTKKRAINWLFLLLSQMLGCCTLEQLKYFCKHTDNHRTGAKDRLLYLTYMSLCKQLVAE